MYIPILSVMLLGLYFATTQADINASEVGRVHARDILTQEEMSTPQTRSTG
jgi:hypothetical protein